MGKEGPEKEGPEKTPYLDIFQTVLNSHVKNPIFQFYYITDIRQS